MEITAENNNIMKTIEETGRYSTIEGQGSTRLEKTILLKNSIGGKNVIPLKDMVGKEIRVIHIIFEKLKENNSDEEYISMTLADEGGNIYRTSGEYARQVVLQSIEYFGEPTEAVPFIFEIEEIQSKKNPSWKYTGLMLKLGEEIDGRKDG